VVSIFQDRRVASDLERHVARLAKVSERSSSNTTMARDENQAWSFQPTNSAEIPEYPDTCQEELTRQDGTKVLGKIIM